MNKTLFLLIQIIICVFIFSCQSNKNINYSEAYQFHFPKPYQPKISNLDSNNTQEGINSEDQIVVSLNSSNVNSNFHNKTQNKIHNDKLLIKSSKKENKELAKALKVAFKKQIKEKKSLKKVSENKEVSMTYLAKGLILTISGFILIVGGILLINPIGLIAGSVIAGIGLIVFLIGLLGLVL